MLTINKGNNINIKLIEDHIKTNKISKTQFCKTCKISPNTYKKVMQNDLLINTLTLFKIAQTLSISIHQLFI